MTSTSESPSHSGSQTPHGRREVNQLALILAILLITTIIGLYDGARYGQVYIFAYIIAVIIAMRGTIRQRRWGELGFNWSILSDFKKNWYLIGAEALLFQVIPPNTVIAYVLGYLPQVIEHISTRVSTVFGSIGGLTTVGGVLAAMAVLTLIEEIVYRATIQERLIWLIGTPTAVILTSTLFGVVHAIGTTGEPVVVLLDILGVAIDGVFLGLIYARTHNLALTWIVHFAGNVVGLLTLTLLFG
jgi:membrane protease YdiL (CAAX protease family)